MNTDKISTNVGKLILESYKQSESDNIENKFTICSTTSTILFDGYSELVLKNISIDSKIK